MRSAIVIVGLAFVMAVVANVDVSYSFCDEPCENNGGCGLPCTHCNTSGYCDAGFGCGMSCNTDTDCDQESGCTICPDGYCTSHGHCLDYCKSDLDCTGTCSSCIGNKCVSECGALCFNNTQCIYAGSTCNQCLDQMCQTGGCGTKCGSPVDCATSGDCTNCIAGVCESFCGGKCNNDFECVGNLTGCGYCDNGVCSTGVCGSLCANNNGCQGTANCTKCTDGICGLGVPCFNPCETDSDCLQTGHCTLCSSHNVCVSPGMSEEEILAGAEAVRKELAASGQPIAAKVIN